jgi:hypothetical protein
VEYRFTTAALGVARELGVERRNLTAVTPLPAPIANGSKGLFDETTYPPRPV